MWKSGEDSGGPSQGEPADSGGADLQEMKDQFEQQQLLITQLKEIMKKSEQSASSVTQEKVAEYANTLTKMKSRAKRHSLAVREGEEVTKSHTPTSEKVLLLRQQLEQNKAKLAERGKNQKGIEEMVAQVKAQLDDSQQQINLSQTPLNISLFEDRVDYTPQLSSQELYNILLNKDKRINEMNLKMSKLQANVLDLQENLKEKDSVIDARTKAITLMSENLSKKGKTTLDALEDTKEQMRRMQENFIEIEEQLKAENVTIRNELDAKSIEVQRLQAENHELTFRNSELEKSEVVLNTKIAELDANKPSPASSPSRQSPSKSRKGKKGKFPSKAEDNNQQTLISDLEKQLEEKNQQVELKNVDIEALKQQHETKLAECETIIKELQSKQKELEKMTLELSVPRETVVKVAKAEVVPDIDIEVDSELLKLKQQLDEANKNMIKVKAQHKSKLKEMTKKLDAFKKISNVNAELVKIENENAKLQLKIAELEEEKGQLQLGMVDSKESTSLDELETTIKDLTSKLEETQSTINTQETETNRYKQEVQTLRERLEQMTSDEVKQELTTAQFEEQYENLEKEKVAFQSMIEVLKGQILEFNLQMETLKKEKSEIQLKYEALLQENAELIDRLEKLSTEKVSSAESIEIVENLTQQEKLEIEAYQKSLLPKTSLENLDENVDLNDSVNQLTEETSELLQKIELFTVERREVMEKLELLTEENNQLSLKLKEVENNRDVLVETYERLQTEKEVLDTKLEEYETQLADFKKHDNVDSSKSEVEEFKKFVEVQRQEISDLQLKLLSYEKNSSSRNEGSEKDKIELEEKYMKLINSYENLELQVKDLEESNKNYDEIINGNKEDLINYAKVLEDNNILKENHNQLCEEHEKVILAKKENDESLQKLQKLLEKEQHKVAKLTENVYDYEKELNDNLERIQILEGELHNLKDEKISIENKLVEKTTEIDVIRQEKQEKEIENEKLLKTQQQDDKASVEVKMAELQNKNKEQLEKMKKIAANLKKKTLDYKELEAKYQELCKKDKVDSQEENKQVEKIAALEGNLVATTEELKQVRKDYEQKGEEILELLEQQRNLQQESSQIKTRNEEITTQLHTYSAQIEDLQNMIREYESQLSALNREMESIRASGIQNQEKDDVIRRLNEEIEALKYNSQTSNNALQLKIHEQEVCIETQDQELQKYKEKAEKLEEGLSEVEARRYSLEQRTIELGKSLENKESSFIEAIEKEEELECRLKALAEKDLVIEQTLLEAQEENSTLHKESFKLNGEIDSYKKQVDAYNSKLMELEEKEELVNIMETQRVELEVRCKTLDNEIKKLQFDLATLQTETDKSEYELQAQLESCALERKKLMEQVEISAEEISVLVQCRKEFQSTIEDLNSKLDQQQNEFEETIDKYATLQQEHKRVLSQLEEFEKLIKSQENELKELAAHKEETPDYLKQLLTNKLGELEEFRRTYVPSPADFFSENTTELRITRDIKELEDRLSESQLKHGGGHLMKVQELQFELSQRVESLQMNEALLKKLQEELVQKDEEIKQAVANSAEGKEQMDFARNMLEQIEANNFETLNRNNELELKLQEILKDKNELELKCSALEIRAQGSQQEKFQWPDTSDDPFALAKDQQDTEVTISQSQAIPVQVTHESSNNQEELLQKIRTLEFMLFNVEQEKENAMIQCAQVSEELGRLIYEREQVASVMLSESHTSNITTTDSQFNIESQIVSGDEISLPPQMPHEDSKDPQLCTSSANVDEDPCRQKRAYECNPSAFADDDGWGFDAEETKLEETHQTNIQVGNTRISNLEEHIRLLNLEKDAITKELQQANVKSGKLIKKLKEFKARNEQLSAKVKAKSSDDFGLDDAIQEELKSQISNLEKKLKEADGELSKERAERESIAKRIDVLTAANERMVEMKEKQDIEMMGYQQQNRELQLKLEKVAWSSDFSEAVVSTSSNTNTSVTSELPMDNTDGRLQELRDTIKELTLDNEEMQAMLEEQTRLRKEAENRAKNVTTDVVDQGQLQAALDATQNLMSQITMHESDKDGLKQELEQMQTNYAKICAECDGVREELRKLGEKLQENYKEKTLLEAAALENGIYIESLKKTIDDMQMQTNLCAVDGNRLQDEINVLKKEKESLGDLISRLEQEKDVMQEELAAAKTMIDDLRGEQQRLMSTRADLESRLENSLRKLEENQLQLTSAQSSIESVETLTQEVAELRMEVVQIGALKQHLLDQQGEYETKLLTNSEQLALEWSAHVDQRGNDVAESWKLHVDTRENEFAQLEAALRKELNDVEERCNALVNENNELRRNVDAEIRNEVDRISTLQSHITQLSEAVQTKSAEVDRLSTENSTLNDKMHEYERRINDGSEELARLIQQQEEKDRNITNLNAQLQLAHDNKQSEEVIDALRTELTAKDNEITRCRDTIDEMTQNIEKLEKVKTQAADNQIQLTELSKEKEKCDKLKTALEESSLQVTTIQGTLQEKEHRLLELEAMLQQQQSQDSNSKMQLQTHVQELQQQIAQYIMQLQENNLHIGSLNEELESYKILGNHLQSKEAEIHRLNGLLEEKNREHEYALENQLLESQSVLSSKTQDYDALRRLLNQTEIARDEVLLIKDSELEAYREQQDNLNKQLGEYQTEYATVQNRLSEATNQITAYEQHQVLGQQQMTEYERQLQEMNDIIEGQVLKIEELQEESFEKSRNYDALVAEMDDTKELQKKIHFAKSSTSSSHEDSKAREEEQGEPVSRAELDLALYMLHQRDVRCEELTVELMQLLEERDTLQLRLSNAIREKEAIRSRMDQGTHLDTTQETTEGGFSDQATSSGKAKAILLGATGTEMATEAKEGGIEGGSLANKLSELKVVGYKKDKTIVDEQELRRVQQMAFIEQHKDAMSRMPAEAQARLLDASYTLSRDVQSPSKVLLNWLWGKSTPKVNNV